MNETCKSKLQQATVRYNSCLVIQRNVLSFLAARIGVPTYHRPAAAACRLATRSTYAAVGARTNHPLLLSWEAGSELGTYVCETDTAKPIVRPLTFL